jgi:hypothetical protein
MLKSILIFILVLLSLPTLACLRIEGKVGVDGQTYKLDQKLDLNQEYNMAMGSFLFAFRLGPDPKVMNQYIFKYRLEERKNNKLVKVSEGDEEVGTTRSHEIFAKGEEGQPNSIITVKFSEI